MGGGLELRSRFCPSCVLVLSYYTRARLCDSVSVSAPGQADSEAHAVDAGVQGIANDRGYGLSRQPRAITAVATTNTPPATPAATTTETHTVASLKPVSPARVASTR